MRRIAFIMSVLLIGLLFLSPLTVFASTPTPSQPPPPDDGTGIAITVVVPRPDVRPVEVIPTPEPEVIEIHHIYPIHVWESREDGRREIIRVYELRDDECPSQIPRHPFERDGFRFELAEIVRREIPAHSLREHTETVSVNTQTNDLASVIRLLSPTLEYLSEDGYFGILVLDVTSIQIESQGTTSSNFTATRTREFPHLSSADTSLVPRTLTYGGRTYNLSNVEWRTQTSSAIDYRQVASTFTAVATYSRVGTRVATIGYTTTAEYIGQVSRIAVGRTEFTAHFIGIPIVTPIVTVPTPPPAVTAPTPEPTSLPTSEPTSIGTVNVDTVHIGGIVIEVEMPALPEQPSDDGDAVYIDSEDTDVADNEADAEGEDVVLAVEDESNSFPFGMIAIALLFIGGVILAYFVGKKGKAMLAGMRKASCFLLALVIAGGLLFGTAQTAYAADIPRYGFGRQGNNAQSNQDTMHFNDSSSEPRSNDSLGEALPQRSTNAVMHFNPSVATSDGVSVRASPVGHFQPGMGNSSGYNYGDTIGILTVERLNRRVTVIAGATMSAMDFGGGHFSFTGLNSGNTALIGHNRGSAGFFSFVRLLREGDIITLEAGGVTRSYAVAMVYYIEDTDFSPLMQFGDNRLTLVTCREYHRTQRRVAVAFAV